PGGPEGRDILPSDGDPMPIRPIVKLGHPALRAPARALTAEEMAAADLQTLIDDMIETMREARGVGLPAPQVGEGLQRSVYQAARPPAAPGAALRVVLSPMAPPQAGELVYDWEGCLSIPELRGLVPRHPAVRVQGFDRTGAALDYVATGFAARIVQHEFD